MIITLILFQKTFERKLQKKFLIDDFNTDLLKFESSEHINKFRTDSSSNCLQLQIIPPIWISGNSKTIIDNIFSNIAKPPIITGAGSIANITGNVSHR